MTESNWEKRGNRCWHFPRGDRHWNLHDHPPYVLGARQSRLPHGQPHHTGGRERAPWSPFGSRALPTPVCPRNGTRVLMGAGEVPLNCGHRPFANPGSRSHTCPASSVLIAKTVLDAGSSNTGPWHSLNLDTWAQSAAGAECHRDVILCFSYREPVPEKARPYPSPAP